jgi:hypothetical protein
LNLFIKMVINLVLARSGQQFVWVEFPPAPRQSADQSTVDE